MDPLKNNHVLNQFLNHVIKELNQIDMLVNFCKIARVTADDVIGVAK